MKKLNTLLVICMAALLLASCNGTDTNETDNKQTDAQTDAQKDAQTKAETEGTESISDTAVTESQEVSEATLPQADTTVSSPTHQTVYFDGNEELFVGKTTRCTAEATDDPDEGRVLKVQATSLLGYFEFEYEKYMTELGIDPIKVNEYKYAVITFKTGAAWGDPYSSTEFQICNRSGNDEKFSDMLKSSYSKKSTEWQTVMFDLFSENDYGTLHTMRIYGMDNAKKGEYYCIKSIDFYTSIADVLVKIGMSEPIPSLTEPLTESVIDGVDLGKKTAPDEDESVIMWFDHSTERTPQSFTDPSGMESYLIRMPGNSIEGCQFFLSPESDRTFSVSLSEFKNSDGNTLKTELYRERYYLVDDEMIPDALPPLDGDISVAANTSQGFYIKVWADANEQSGLYTAELEVKDAVTDKVIKVATVYTYIWDFSLSEETAMKTAMMNLRATLFTSYSSNNMTEMSNENLYKLYYDFMLENRICLADLPYSITDEKVLYYINNPRVTAFCISGDASKSYSVLKDNPEAQRKGYFYPVDEPDSEAELKQMKSSYESLSALYPNPRIVAPFYINLQLQGKDQIEYMRDYLSIWNTQGYAFTPRKYAEFTGARYLTNTSQDKKYGTFDERMANEVAEGDELWYYCCCGPERPYLNWMMTGDGVEPLVSVWQCRNTKCTGMLYWHVSNWTTNMKATLNGVDVWGDGVLLYSGAEYGLYEPISSLRLENLRDGIEDYQMLDMVEKLAGAEAADEITHLVTVDVIAFTNDDDRLHAARVLLGEKTESLCKK